MHFLQINGGGEKTTQIEEVSVEGRSRLLSRTLAGIRTQHSQIDQPPTLVVYLSIERGKDRVINTPFRWCVTANNKVRLESFKKCFLEVILSPVL